MDIPCFTVVSSSYLLRIPCITCATSLPPECGIQQFEEKNHGRTQRGFVTKETYKIASKIRFLLVSLVTEPPLGMALRTESAFRDAICLCCGWQPPLLPSHCICGSIYTVEHAMNCPSGGFPSIRHNEVRDLTSVRYVIMQNLHVLCSHCRVSALRISLPMQS